MLKRPNSLLLIILVFTFAILPLYAQEAEDNTDNASAASDDIFVFEVDDIIIEDELPDEEDVITPGQVTVFEREDIESSGARTAAEVVERAPGVVVSKQGGILEPQSVSIRGGEAEHVLVLIDGKAADSLWSGGADLSMIPVAEIERVEVIRGAAAAVYGEGAVSGVINIITTGAAKEQLEGGLEYGFASFNTHQLDGHLSGPFGEDSGVSGSITAGGLYTGGGYEYDISDTETLRTNNDGWAAHAAGSLDILDGDLSVSGSFYASERGTPGLMEFLTPEARTETLRGGCEIDYGFETVAAGSFGFAADYAYRFSGYTNPEDGIDDSNENSSAGASAGWSIDWEGLGALWGASVDCDYRFNYLYSTALTDSTGSSVGGDAVQHAVSLRALADMIWGAFDLSPAVGLDWNLNHYSALEPAGDIAFTWMAAGGWSPFRTDYEEGPLYIKLNGGTAYRSPSFQDLFWPSGALASGNPDLRPETSISVDGGASYDFAGGEGFSARLEAVGFFSRTKDLIQWMPSAGGVWKPRNIGVVHSGGIEASGSIRFEELIGGVSLDIRLNYNWLVSVDADPESVNYMCQLAYRPPHSGNLSILFSIPEMFTLDLTCGYIGYRYTNNANQKSIPQVFILSAAGGYDFNEHFGLSISADNLLNISYTDRLGYPVPGIEWCLKGRVSL